MPLFKGFIIQVPGFQPLVMISRPQQENTDDDEGDHFLDKGKGIHVQENNLNSRNAIEARGK